MVKELMGLTEMLERAKSLSANYVLVRHGKWIPSLEYNGYMVCSECDNAYVEPDWVTAGNVKWHYCPNCGAKMDGGKNDV